MEREGGRLWRFARHIPAFLLCAVVVVYCSYHLLSSLVPKPVVEPAVLTEYTETVTLNGYIFREEQILTSPTSGTVLSTRSDGEKVAAGNEVGKVYASVNEESYDALLAVRRRLTILENAKTTYASVKNAPQVLALIEESVLKYNAAVQENDMDSAMELRDTILAARAQYQALTTGYTSYADIIAGLEAQVAALEAALGTAVSSVFAPVSGYYYRDVDGYETAFDASGIDSLTVSSFRSAVASEPSAYAEDSRTAGKLVTDHTWYAVAETDRATAARFTAGQAYSVRFLLGDQTAEMTLYRTVTSSEEDAVLLIFSSNRMTADFNYSRVQKVEVTVSSGEGYAIPKEAVRSVDGKTGVYILDRYVVRFREISILSEQNGMYLCDPEFVGEGRLALYDSVIVSGKDLYDGKVLD